MPVNLDGTYTSPFPPYNIFPSLEAYINSAQYETDLAQVLQAQEGNPMPNYKVKSRSKLVSETSFPASNVPIEPVKGFKFGCDPELFIIDGKGVPVSAYGLIPGTKEQPYKVPKGAIQVDGMAAEFNIDPAESFEEFDDNIVTVMKTLQTYLPKGHKFSIVPSIVFPESIIAEMPDAAKELGCNPDFNAWSGLCNPPPKPPENQPGLRTASGHLHIGWTEDAGMDDLQHIVNCRDLVRQLDWYLGAWSLRHDSDSVRRVLYGKAGACRYKSYGVEYRVLSNFWLVSKELRLQVWNRMCKAIQDIADTYIPDKAGGTFNKQLVQSINTSVVSHDVERWKYPVLTIDPSYR